MFVSPADFQAYSEATGTPLPTNARERAALTPDVVAWKEAQQRTQVITRDEGSLAPLIVGGGLLAAGAGGLALYQQLRRKGVDPKNAADAAVAVENAASADQQASLRNLYERLKQERGVQDVNLESSFRGPAARLIPANQKSRLEKYDNTGGDVSHDTGAYRYSGGAFHSSILEPVLDALGRGDVDGFVNVLGNSIAQMPQKEINALLREVEAAASRVGGTIKPGVLARGLDEMAKFGAIDSRDAVGLSRGKSNATSQTNYQSEDEKAQFGATSRLMKESGAKKAVEIDGSYSANPLGDLYKSLLGESADRSTIENQEVIIQDVRRAHPQKRGEDNKTYGERIMDLVRSIPDAYVKPAEVDSDFDNKLAEVFYLDSDGERKIYRGGKRIVRDDGTVMYTGRKSNKQPIALSDLAFYPIDDGAFYGAPVDRFGKPEGVTGGLKMEMHPYLTLEEIVANSQEAEMARPVFFDQEDPLIKDLMESLPYSRRGEGAVRPNLTDAVGVAQWSVDPTTGERKRDDTLTYLQQGYRQKEPGGGGARAAGQLLDLHIKQAVETSGAPPAPNLVVQRASELAREFNTDPNSVLRAAYLGKPLSAKPGLSENHAADRRETLAEAGRRNKITGWKGAPAAKRIGSPSDDDAFTNLLVAAGRHAGADTLEMERFIRQGRITEAANALVRVMPKMAATFKGQMGGLSAEERMSVIGMAVTSGIQDLSALLQKKPELAGQFGMGAEGNFDVDAFLKGYVRNFVVLDGLAASDKPVYQVPSDSFERIALMHRDLAADPSIPVDDSDTGLMKTLEMVAARAGSTSRTVLTLDQLTSTAASERDVDPNATATRLAESLFTSEDPDLQGLNARKTARAVDSTPVNLNFATRRQFDVTKGFMPSTKGRQLDASTIEDRVEAYTDGVGPAAYDENSFLKARLKSLDTEAPNYNQLVETIEGDLNYIDENANRFERAKALLNTGRRPDRPDLSEGDNLVIEPGGRIGFGSSRTSLNYETTSRENVEGPLLSDDRLEDINREPYDLELSTEDLAPETADAGQERASGRESRRIADLEDRWRLDNLYTSPTNREATGQPMVQLAQGEVAEPLDYKNIGPTTKRPIDAQLQQRVAEYNFDRPYRVAAALEQLPQPQPFEMPRQEPPQQELPQDKDQRRAVLQERRAQQEQRNDEFRREFGGGGGSGELGQPKLFSLLDDDGNELKGQAFWQAWTENDEAAAPGRQQRMDARKASLEAELVDLESELSGGFENRYNTPNLQQNNLSRPAVLTGGGEINSFVIAKEDDPKLWEERVGKRIGEIRSQLYPRPQGDPDVAVTRTPRAPEATPMAANSGEDFARRQVAFTAARQGIVDRDVSYVTELPNVGNPPTQPLTTPGAARQNTSSYSEDQLERAWRTALASRITAAVSGKNAKGESTNRYGPLGIEGRKGDQLSPWQEPSPAMLNHLVRRFNL